MLPTLFREIDYLMNNVEPEYFKSYYENVDGTYTKEEEDHYKLAIQLPGFKKEDLKITLENNLLKIEGFSKDWTCERTYKKEFRLGDKINSENVSCKLENGILNVVLPKVEKAKKKLIEIKLE